MTLLKQMLAQRKLINIIFLFAVCFIMSSCTSLDKRQLVQVVTSHKPDQAFKKYVKNKSHIYQESPDLLIKDAKQLEITLKNLSKIVQSIWGKDNGQVASKKKYVKYTNRYQSKAQVDFEIGIIKIETIAQEQPVTNLKKAIVTTLLTSENPANTDIFSDKSPIISETPYLHGQVLDQDQKPIAFKWRANRFAEYLLKTQLKRKRVNNKLIHYVEIAMVNKHHQLRRNKYAPIVLSAANRYQIKPELIYAVIETESSFNPFAVSPSNAYGLMQIIPKTAGKDVYQRILKRPGIPSKQLLFTANENIEIGTAYLHILQQQYLKKIINPLSRHYSVISAYNGGAGNVFKTFSRNRENAPTVINKLSPNQVYNKLTKKHPRSESRNYLTKVTAAEKRYSR